MVIIIIIDLIRHTITGAAGYSIADTFTDSVTDIMADTVADAFTLVFPLDLKGRFKVTLAVLYITGTFYARYVFWRIFVLVFEHYYNFIKGRLYANHMSGIKHLFMILNKHKGEFMCRELVALNAVGGAEHAYFLYTGYCGWS